MHYDIIIIGAGLYGLFAAAHCGKQGRQVLVLEKDEVPFSRATTINQARVHMGYHYPRSISTALRSAEYFDRFNRDFAPCIKADFQQVYATSAAFSWTGAAEFQRFCDAANIPCQPLPPGRYFQPGLCDGAFLTTEYTYDAAILLEMLKEKLAALPNVELRCGHAVNQILKQGDHYFVSTETGSEDEAPFVLNAGYASVNEIATLAGFEPFNIKYELCELILCDVEKPMADLGITVMDGPFFSIMPYGKTGMHSLTSVTFTPHVACYEPLPSFPCQQKRAGCTPKNLANCDSCPHRPASAWPAMSQLARKYLRAEYGFSYKGSLFSIKPILKASEVDDSRPTLVRVMSQKPTFVSVLSGKINTVFDVLEVLDG